MREILFRGKRIDNGEWIQGFLVIWGNDYYIAPDINAYTSMGGRGKGRCTMFGHYYQVLPETIGQYTGLTDKNGKKIFEGDILKIHYTTELFGETLSTQYNALVMFEDGCNVAKGIFDGAELVGDLSAFSNDEVEVIGNIHDNPELLEEKE